MTHVAGIDLHFVVVLATPNADVKRSVGLRRKVFCLRRKIAPPFTHVIDMKRGICSSMATQDRQDVGAVCSLPQRNFYRCNGANAVLIDRRTAY